MKTSLLLTVAAGFVLLWPPLTFAQDAAQSTEAATAVASVADYTAGRQDVLEVTVFGEPEVSGKFLIEADGTINFPLLGRVNAAGVTLRAIEKELRQRLADGYLQNPQVSVNVGSFRSQRIFIVGEVLKPGPYPLTADMSLIEALATAGSTTPGAAGHAVIVRNSRNGEDARGPRAASDVVQIDLGPFQTGALSENVRLRDGDVVVVPRAESIYILGQVKNPGPFRLEKPTTVLQALALAGGVTERASMSRIRIVRIVNGKKTEVKASVEDVVRAGDTIMVLERFF
jgi:polysaccharide biosynthesis/export protein